MKTLRDVLVGDTVFRWLADLDSPMELRVTAVTSESIICGPWEFDRETGAEIDEGLGWGPAFTGSYIRATTVRPENN